MQKMQAKQPDVIAFNGYAAQYKKEPIAVKEGRDDPDVRVELRSPRSGPRST